MKLYHFVLAFVIIIITTVLITDIRTNNLKAVIENKEEIENKLKVAIDDAAFSLMEIGANNQFVISKEHAMESFFTSLYTSFGILSDKTEQAKLLLYVPVIAVTEDDGYYVYFSDEFTGEDGYTYVSHRWSEKLPYYYEDNDFIYGFTLGERITIYDKNGILDSTGIRKVYQQNYMEMRTTFSFYFTDKPNHFLLTEESFHLVRKGAIKACIEKSMAYHASLHNKIASQYGITYNFALPQTRDDQWMPFLDDISIFIVFQGYPYGTEAGEVYHRFASAGAKLSKENIYYIEQVEWYLVYHRSGCPKLTESSILYDDTPYYSIESCALKGAYGCEYCCPNEIHAPDYEIAP